MTAAGREIPTLAVPFANSDAFLDYSFYRDGITPSMTIPTGNGGSPFTRHQMNGVGYLASLGFYLWQMGYPFSKEDVAKAATFGGYPKGAIIFFKHDSGYVVEYESKVDNNLNPIPSLQGNTPVEDDYWKPLYETLQKISVPNYETVLAEVNQTVTPDDVVDNSFSVSLSIPSSAMVAVSRTLKDYSNLTRVNIVYGVPLIEVKALQDNGKSVALGTMPLSDGSSSGFSFPMGPGTVVVSSSNYNAAIYGNIDISITAYSLGE